MGRVLAFLGQEMESAWDGRLVRAEADGFVVIEPHPILAGKVVRADYTRVDVMLHCGHKQLFLQCSSSKVSALLM